MSVDAVQLRLMEFCVLEGELNTGAEGTFVSVVVTLNALEEALFPAASIALTYIA